MSIQTTTHRYPQEELDAMGAFYGDKKCIIAKTINNVQWAHMLDAASNQHVGQTLIGFWNNADN